MQSCYTWSFITTGQAEADTVMGVVCCWWPGAFTNRFAPELVFGKAKQGGKELKSGCALIPVLLANNHKGNYCVFFVFLG